MTAKASAREATRFIESESQRVVHFVFNEKERVDTIQKKFIVNPKLIDLSKKLIFTKILYDANKKR